MRENNVKCAELSSFIGCRMLKKNDEENFYIREYNIWKVFNVKYLQKNLFSWAVCAVTAIIIKCCRLNF